MKSAAEMRDTMHIKEIPTFRARLVIGLLIFLLAFGVRVLSWHDTRLEVGKVQTAVTADYKRVAQLLRDGGAGSFFSSSSPLADLNNLGHPPGYSILLALIYKLFGQSGTAVQFAQIVCDALAAVVIFMIVAELFPLSAGVIAGLLAAFSPQFAWNSVLLLPDSISVLPILIAIYLIARAATKPRLVTFLIAGALVGISCWLRANAMLLTFFVAAAVPLLIRFGVPPSGGAPRKRGTPNRRQDGVLKWRFAMAVVCGTLLIMLPLTIRNAIVFHRFIPLSLGAGQTLLEGIADYDTQGRFGIPRTDMGIMKQEAEIYHRPNYYGTLFNPDGVERERARLSRGFTIIRSNPFWFAGVMVRRASSMVRLERSRLVSTEPAITHSLDSSAQPTSIKNQNDMMKEAIKSSTATIGVVFDGAGVTVSGDASPYGVQVMWPIDARPNLDYVVQIPIQVERGRIRVSMVSTNHAVLSSAVVETVEGVTPVAQPPNLIELPFVADDAHPKIVVSNEASVNPSAEVGPIRIYELGPARFLWTRYPRFAVHAIQKIFLTAVMLPLAIFGLLVMIFQKQSRALVILSIVPLYFFTVQSIVHTEYRYVLAVDYFLFALVGIGVSTIGAIAGRRAPQALNRR
jgi:hypothetical protein